MDLTGGDRKITSNGAVVRFFGTISNGALTLDDQTCGGGHIWFRNACNTYAGGTTILGGEIKYNTNSPFGTGTITIDGNVTLYSYNAARTLANNFEINSCLVFDWHANPGSTITTGDIRINTGGLFLNSDDVDTTLSDLILNGGTLSTNGFDMGLLTLPSLTTRSSFWGARTKP